jgi:hypothetical protein
VDMKCNLLLGIFQFLCHNIQFCFAWGRDENPKLPNANHINIGPIMMATSFRVVHKNDELSVGAILRLR